MFNSGFFQKLKYPANVSGILFRLDVNESFYTRQSFVVLILFESDHIRKFVVRRVVYKVEAGIVKLYFSNYTTTI